MKNREIYLDFALGLGIPIILTLPFLFFPLDLKIESLFFSPLTGSWPYADVFPWDFLYRYGPLLLLLSGIIAIALIILSYFKKYFIAYRLPMYFFLASIAFGPGYLVNSTLKEYTGRPRPREVVEFHGDKTFLYPFQLGTAGNGQSFPSGHAAAGFALFGLALALRQINRRRGRQVFCFTLIYGTIMGIGRMAQGGHFPSDIVWAGGTCWLGASFLYHFIFFPAGNATFSNTKKGLISLFLLIMLIQIFLFTAYFKRYDHREKLSGQKKELHIFAPEADFTVLFADSTEEIQLTTISQGFGATNVRLEEQRTEDQSSINYSYYFERIVLKQNSTVSVSLDTTKYDYGFDGEKKLYIRNKSG